MTLRLARTVTRSRAIATPILLDESSDVRQPGLVRATCWLPHNLLAEGHVTVTAAVSSYNPTVVYGRESDAVAVMVVDRRDGDGGAHAQDPPGVVRPLLEWSDGNHARAPLPDGAVRR